eukprot:6954724-Prymnesium_polylepis.1
MHRSAHSRRPPPRAGSVIRAPAASRDPRPDRSHPFDSARRTRSPRSLTPHHQLIYSVRTARELDPALPLRSWRCTSFRFGAGGCALARRALCRAT